MTVCALTAVSAVTDWALKQLLGNGAMPTPVVPTVGRHLVPTSTSWKQLLPHLVVEVAADQPGKRLRLRRLSMRQSLPAAGSNAPEQHLKCDKTS